MAEHPSEMISAALKKHYLEHRVERGKTRTIIRVPFSNPDNIRLTHSLIQHLGLEPFNPGNANFIPGVYHRFLSSIRGLPKTHEITVQHGPAGYSLPVSEIRIRMRNQPLKLKERRK